MKLPTFFRKKKGGRNNGYGEYLSLGHNPYVNTRESLGRLEEKIDSPFDHQQHKDRSRSNIAYVFVFGYVGIVVLILLGVPIYNWLALNNPQPLELEKTLAQAGTLLGAPVGFVVGYYFKEEEKD
jgi:hypothetical protein